MKKFLMILAAVICFKASANADVILRSQQAVCSGSVRIILKDNGTCQIWTNSILQYSGTYIIEDNTIIMFVDGKQFRAKTTMNDKQTKLLNLTFNGVEYRPCS
ncbi:MAG: hypothetical protein LBK47_10325 [Prevotellaceae bacterium]|jgi:hypothetical protein|nr:hypothetical protein [Prevotellaceae bacterium]